MLKKDYTPILLILLIISTIMAVVGFMSKPRGSSNTNIEKATSVDQLNGIKAKMWDNYVSLIIDEDKKVADTIRLKDTAGISYTIKNLSNRRYKLVVRYSFMDCDKCIKILMSKIENYGNKNGFKDILVFTDAYDEHDFYVKVTNAKFKIPIYNLDYDRLGMFIENKNFPFLFILTPDLRVTKIFLPSKELPDHIDEYLTYIQAYFKSVNQK